MAQRLGSLARMVMIKEATWGSDTATEDGRIVPLQAADGFTSDQPRTPANIYDGRRQFKGSTKGMISAAGPLPVSLDFRFIGLPLDIFHGHDVYSRVGTLHRWVDFGDPGSCQLQREHQQTPVIYNRNKGVRIGGFEITVQMSGQSMYTPTNTMGKGEEVYTDNARTLVDDGPFVANNYFDGALIKSGVTALGKVTAFSAKESSKLTRQDAAFSAGLAAGINAGIPEATGDLGLIYDTADGDAFYLEAINDTIISLECVWFNKPLTAGPTMWLRKRYPAVLLSRKNVAAGGDAGLTNAQTWVAQLPTAATPAELIGTTIGPYLIAAAAALDVSIDGAADDTITLTAGAARTTDQIVTDLNADVTFAAVAIADNFYGRLRIRSLSSASTSSVQAKATSTAGVLTALGLDTTARTETPAAGVITELYNDLAIDY